MESFNISIFILHKTFCYYLVYSDRDNPFRCFSTRLGKHFLCQVKNEKCCTNNDYDRFDGIHYLVKIKNEFSRSYYRTHYQYFKIPQIYYEKI